MSADVVATVMVSVGASLILAAALVIIAVAHVYQGGHARPLEAVPKDRKRCRVYHRLSPDERRSWRRAVRAGFPQPGPHPILPVPMSPRRRSGTGGRPAHPLPIRPGGSGEPPCGVGGVHIPAAGRIPRVEGSRPSGGLPERVFPMQEKDTHMMLRTGYDPPRALCHPDTRAPLVTEPADVTCEQCQWMTSRIIRDQEREEAQARAEDGG